MLFNSPEFLFVFLPATLAGVWFSLKAGRPAALFALILASLVFYAWWAPRGLAVIGVSIAVNFIIALWLNRARERGATRRVRLAILWAGIALNVAALSYFKYANFFL